MKRYPDVRVVQVESFVPKELGPNEEGTNLYKLFAKFTKSFFNPLNRSGTTRSR